MAISFVGTGGFIAGAGAISAAAPSGGASGDLILLFVNTANQAPPSTPTLNSVAMTAVNSIGTGTAGAAGAVAIYVYRAWHNGTSYTAEVGDSGSYQAAVQVYLRGVDSTPLETAATRVDASATLTVTWPSPGTVTSGEWVCQAIGLDQDANNAALDVFSTTPTNTGYQANGVVGGTTFDTGAITNAGAGGGLWVGFFNDTYALTGGTYNFSSTHAQITFRINAPTAVNGTLTTTEGQTATAAGGQGALTGTTNATLTTTTGVTASAAGGEGTLTGTSPDATLTTTTGTAAAAGETGTLTGTASATLTTTTGIAASAGGTGSLYATADATLTTTTGNAGAAGGMGGLRVPVAAHAGSATSSGCWVDPLNATGSPDDGYATWTSAVDGETSCELIVSNFGTWASIPDGATIDSVQIAVEHHESHTGAPIETVTAQAYLGSTPLGTATNLTLSLTDHVDVLTPSLTLADLQGNTLAVRIVADRTG